MAPCDGQAQLRQSNPSSWETPSPSSDSNAVEAGILDPALTKTRQTFSWPYIRDISEETNGSDGFDFADHLPILYAALTPDFVPPGGRYSVEFLKAALDICWSSTGSLCEADHEKHDDHHCLCCRRWMFWAIWNITEGGSTTLKHTTCLWIRERCESRAWIATDEPKDLSFHYWVEEARRQYQPVHHIPDHWMGMWATMTSPQQTRLIQVIETLRNTDGDFNPDRYHSGEEIQSRMKEMGTWQPDMLGLCAVWPYAPVATRERALDDMDRAVLRKVAELEATRDRMEVRLYELVGEARAMQAVLGQIMAKLAVIEQDVRTINGNGGSVPVVMPEP